MIFDSLPKVFLARQRFRVLFHQRGCSFILFFCMIFCLCVCVCVFEEENACVCQNEVSSEVHSQIIIFRKKNLNCTSSQKNVIYFELRKSGAFHFFCFCIFKTSNTSRMLRRRKKIKLNYKKR